MRCRTSWRGAGLSLKAETETASTDANRTWKNTPNSTARPKIGTLTHPTTLLRPTWHTSISGNVSLGSQASVGRISLSYGHTATTYLTENNVPENRFSLKKSHRTTTINKYHNLRKRNLLDLKHLSTNNVRFNAGIPPQII